MSNEDMASRIQVYLKKIEKIRVKRMKREKFKHLLKTLGLPILTSTIYVLSSRARIMREKHPLSTTFLIL